MTKVLSQAGTSLADVYDVEGSIAGIDQLVTQELPIMHEMGGTVFAERLVGIVRTLTTGALLQSTDFDVLPTDFPTTPFRVANVALFANQVARARNVMVGVRTTTDSLEGEIPIFLWDDTNDLESNLRIRLLGAAVNDEVALIPRLYGPSIVVGTERPEATNVITFRGRTTAFGAGNVTITALIYIVFALQRGLSSRGLPIPSW